MKKVTLILFFFMQFFAVAEVYAECNLSKFSFGSSIDNVEEKLKAMGADKSLPVSGPSGNDSSQDRYSLVLAGELICKNDKEFLGAPIEMVFLYDKLVEIYIYKFIEFGDSPELVNWAESSYGAKDFKPEDFYAPKPNAFWLWDAIDSTVFYTLESIEYGVNEEIKIQTNKYEDLYKKYSEVQDDI